MCIHVRPLNVLTHFHQYIRRIQYATIHIESNLFITGTCVLYGQVAVLYSFKYYNNHTNRINFPELCESAPPKSDLIVIYLRMNSLISSFVSHNKPIDDLYCIISDSKLKHRIEVKPIPGRYVL